MQIMNNDKNKIIQLGKYTINSIYFKLFLTASENTLFDLIVHSEDIKQKYVSNSLIEVYSSLTKNTIIKSKNNLIALNLISIVNETKKGTVYKIHWNILYNNLNKICEENNPIKRLIIADTFREKHNLIAFNKKTIEKYENSPFDINLEKDETIEEIKSKKEVSNKKIKDVLIEQLNTTQIKLNQENISLTEKNTLQNEINRLRNVAKIQNKKIILDKNIKEWKLITK